MKPRSPRWLNETSARATHPPRPATAPRLGKRGMRGSRESVQIAVPGPRREVHSYLEDARDAVEWRQR